MTVKELVDKLITMNPEATVILEQSGDQPGADCIEVQDNAEENGFILLCADIETYD